MATHLWGLTHSSSVGPDCCPLCAAVSRGTPSLGWEQMDIGSWVVLCGAGFPVGDRISETF